MRVTKSMSIRDIIHQMEHPEMSGGDVKLIQHGIRGLLQHGFIVVCAWRMVNVLIAM